MDGAGFAIGAPFLPGVFRAGSISCRWYVPPGVLGFGLASTTMRSGARENMLETPGVFGLPAGVLARLSRAGVFAPPGVFAEGVLALFIHDAGMAANVLPGVFASADVDGSSEPTGSVAAPAMAGCRCSRMDGGGRRAVCDTRVVVGLASSFLGTDAVSTVSS